MNTRRRGLALATSLLTISLTGCPKSTEDREVDAREPDSQKLVDLPYSSARSQVIDDGWQPIKAACSERMVCFGDPEVELVTNLDDGHTCGRFSKGAQILTVCVEHIADGDRVVSVDTTD